MKKNSWIKLVISQVKRRGGPDSPSPDVPSASHSSSVYAPAWTFISLHPPPPRLVRSLPGGLAEIHGAACPNVDSKRKNVRSKVTLKSGGAACFGPDWSDGVAGIRRPTQLLLDPQTNGPDKNIQAFSGCFKCRTVNALHRSRSA